MLMPLSQVHAHISGPSDQHVDVHGGHSHDVGHGHDGAAEEHDGSDVDKHDGASTVVSLKPDFSQGGLQLWKAIQWIAATFAIAIIVLELPAIPLIPRPPRTRTRPPSPYPHALPLLRGPPVSI